MGLNPSGHPVTINVVHWVILLTLIVRHRLPEVIDHARLEFTGQLVTQKLRKAGVHLPCTGTDELRQA